MASWPWLLLSVAIHTAYQLFLGLAYEQGDLSRVYPIARGAAPVLVLGFSLVALDEALAWGELTGVLVLESPEGAGAGLGKLDQVLRVRAPGYVEAYMGAGRPVPPRPIVLRQGTPPSSGPYGEVAADLRSEALMRLDLGKGRLPGMLAMGSEDPHRFKPGQGTDLIAFFTGAFERILQRWLS